MKQHKYMAHIANREKNLCSLCTYVFFKRLNYSLTINAIVVLLFLSFSTAAQQQEEVKSIKIKRENVLVKAAFNESEYKVIAFDRFGNPHEQAIKSFSIYYKDGKNTYEAPVIGNQFPDKTIQFLTKKKATATKICLTKIKAEDKEGHLEDLPDLCDIVIFPDCKKVNKSK